MNISSQTIYVFLGVYNEHLQPNSLLFAYCNVIFQEFIMNNPRQTEQLLSAILEHSSVSMQLVTFFSPNDNADSFTTMYRRILESTDEDLVFSLLTKVSLFYLPTVGIQVKSNW